MKNTPKFLLMTLLLAALCAGCKKSKECPECQNGGGCIDFVCDCPEGYAGERCQTEKTPTLITVKTVALLSYPATNNGAAWDDFSQYADPYFVVRRYEFPNAFTIFTSPYKDEVPPAQGASWQTSGLSLLPNTTYTVTFYDYDSSGVESVVASIDLLPSDVYKAGGGFPVVITVGRVSLIVGYSF